MESIAPIHAARRMPGWITASMACLGLLLAASAAFAAATGYSRDFGPHRVSDEACPVCHTPRHAGASAPAWNHAFADGAYPLYADTVLAPDEPGAATKVCLSCHDGTLASGAADHGSGGHPVGIDYAVARSDGRSALADPGTLMSTSGSARTRPGNLMQTMLPGGRVECTSCHDAHATYTVGGHSTTKARMDMLCLSCHTM